MAEAVLNRMWREGRAAAAPAHLWHCRRPRTQCWSYRVDEGPGGTGRTHCILAETLRQRGNRDVTNKHLGIRFVFLVMTNTWAIGERADGDAFPRRISIPHPPRISKSSFARPEIYTSSIGPYLNKDNGSPIYRLVSFNTSSAFSRGVPLRTWIWSKVAWLIDSSWPQSRRARRSMPANLPKSILSTNPRSPTWWSSPKIQTVTK
jgi:hypothetical protein